MSDLNKLESKSIYIIREAHNKFKNMALLWSVGKDSTVLLWLCKKAFFGKMPFPVIHIDTTYKFDEIYKFRDKYVKEWGLKLIISKNEGALKKGVKCGQNKLECCNKLKTEALKKTIKKFGFDALLVGIRRDEHGIRAKERYFSPRNKRFKWNYLNQEAEVWDYYISHLNQEDHMRVHPLLHWNEKEIWGYIQRENIPVSELYFAKNGKRYRSIGCRPGCNPIDSNADTIKKIIGELKTTKVSERSGRAQDKEREFTMQKLRSLGYM